jgi:hypothetical protein
MLKNIYRFLILRSSKKNADFSIETRIFHFVKMYFLCTHTTTYTQHLAGNIP